MFSGKTKISKKEDSEKSSQVFKLLAEEIQTFSKQTVEPFSNAIGALDEGMSSLGLNRLRAERNRPGISDDQDDQQAGDRVWLANQTFVPMPATPFQVTEGLFLPVAAGILMTP